MSFTDIEGKALKKSWVVLLGDAIAVHFSTLVLVVLGCVCSKIMSSAPKSTNKPEVRQDEFL